MSKNLKPTSKSIGFKYTFLELYESFAHFIAHQVKIKCPIA